MTFKEWLKSLEEVSTSTADVAVFARPVGGITNSRMYPEPVVLTDNKKKKHGKEKGM